jgi:hypothetical protein
MTEQAFPVVVGVVGVVDVVRVVSVFTKIQTTATT